MIQRCNLFLQIVTLLLSQIYSTTADQKPPIDYHNPDTCSNFITPETSAFIKTINNLRDYIEDNDGYTKPVDLFFPKDCNPDLLIDENYRGIKFRSDTKQNEIVGYIPHHSLITNILALNQSKLAQTIYRHRQEIYPLIKDELFIALFLIEEFSKKSNSSYKPYQDVLPTSLDNLPVNFSGEEQKELKKNEFVDLIFKRKTEINEAYKLVIKKIPEFGSKYANFRKFTHMMQLVGSRAFSWQIQGNVVTSMVPFQDSFNHSDENPNLNYDNHGTKGRVIIKANQFFTKNEEATVSYTGHSIHESSRCFVNYGFVSKPFEKVESFKFLHELDSADLFYQEKLKFISQVLNEKPGPGFEFYMIVDIPSDSDKIKQAFTGLRLMCIDNNRDWLHMQKYSIEEIRSLSAYVSVWNEIQVFKTIERLSETELNQYHTDIQKDYEILENGFLENGKILNMNLRNIVKWRIKEKLFLKWLGKMARDLIGFYEAYKYKEMKSKRYDIVYSEYKEYFDLFELDFV